jgi:subtilisin-like proprotein convertase family protein
MNNQAAVFDADVDAPEGWWYLRDAGIEPRETIVAVLDSGVDWLHPDLIHRMWTNPGEIAGNGLDDDGNGYVDDVHGYDFVGQDGDPMDGNGHGTHVAGIIAAEHDNGIGIAGINPYARIMAIRIFDDAGRSVAPEKIAEAIDYSVRMGAKVANYSWGSNGLDPVRYRLYRDAIRRAAAAGQFIAIAGSNDTDNNDIRPYLPANIEATNTLAVASSTAMEQLSSFSNYGVTKVHVASPGSDIISTYPRRSPDGGAPFYRVEGGTSMAAPVVAGIASVLKSAYPSLTPLQIRNRILGSVERKPAYGQVVASRGRVNLFDALHTATDALSGMKLYCQAGGDSGYSFLTDRTSASDWSDEQSTEFWAGSFFTKENVPVFVFDLLAFKKAIVATTFNLKVTGYESPDSSESYELIYLNAQTPEALRDRPFSQAGASAHQAFTTGMSCGTLQVQAALGAGGMASIQLPAPVLAALNQRRLAGGGPVLFSLRPATTSNVAADQNITLDPGGSFLEVGLRRTQPLPVVTLAVSPAVVPEDGSQSLVFTFTRSGSTGLPLTVTYNVAGTALAAALGEDPADYTGLSAGSGPKQITFAAGSATATLQIAPIADRRAEPLESVVLSIAAGAGYQKGGTAVATGQIRDDDQNTLPGVSLRVAPAVVREDGGQPLVFTFSRTGATTEALNVLYRVGGTALPVAMGTNPADYRGLPAPSASGIRQITIPAGSASIDLRLEPIADTQSEPHETLTLSLAPSAAYQALAPQGATGRISNDDAAPASLFRNSQAIAIPSSGPAALYPSSLTVDGLTGAIVDVNVTLHDLSHPFPDDLDILLLSPAGQAVMLLSDCGGATDADGVTLELDQQASTALPDSGELVSGRYRPTSMGGSDDRFPEPSPPAPFSATLAAFHGSTANGVWKLFVLDDTVQDAGAIAGGWSLAITTAP